MEQTFIMISPDGVRRGLVNETISKFEKMRFSLKGSKIITVDRRFPEHHADLFATLFFSGSVDYITSRCVFVTMVWEGENVVLTGQKIIGATNPSESAPGTIRGDLAVQNGRNFIHGSDSVESAIKEIALWFSDGPVDWESGLRHLMLEHMGDSLLHRYNIYSLPRMEFENFNLREGLHATVIARVRNQEGFGICWAMAIISVMEYMIANQYNRDIILSSQEMVDSQWAELEITKSTPAEVDQLGGYAMDIFVVFVWMEKYGVTANFYKYVGQRQYFGGRQSGTLVAYITNYTVIDPNNEELMIETLHEGFCLCASFLMFEEFKVYKYEENAVYEGTSAEAKTSDSVHAVVITGYGTTPGGKKFWWIKNSWGARWGDNGFGKLYRGSDAFNPSTGQRDLNLLLRVIACKSIALRLSC